MCPNVGFYLVFLGGRERERERQIEREVDA